MKSLEIYLEAHPVLFGLIAAAIPFLFPKFRAWAKMVWGKIRAAKLAQAHKIDLILSDVKEIKAEVRFSNDTSTKQEVALIKRRLHRDFWTQNKPAIEMDADAKVIHVSETLCRLMGVWNPADLHLRNWLRCVEADRVDDFLHAFTETVKFKSDFDFIFRIQTKDGIDQGQWKLMMADVTPHGYSTTVYSGFFKPLDERAKLLAEGLHWSK